MPPTARSRSRTPSPTKPTLSSSFTNPTDAASTELTTAVDDLLDQLRNRFASVSKDIFGKSGYLNPDYLIRVRHSSEMEGGGGGKQRRVDEMTRRLDILERQMRADEKKESGVVVGEPNGVAARVAK